MDFSLKTVALPRGERQSDDINQLSEVLGKSGPTELQSISGANPKSKLPIVVAEWDRNAREVIRVALDLYNGHHTINIRVWYRDGDDLRPSKSGITLGLKRLTPLASSLNNACDLANRLGLMIDGGEQ